jgi:hypothetical protein
MIDQLVKHHRINFLPLRLLKVADMHYGIAGLGTTDKTYFTRDASRKDYFCVSTPVILPLHCITYECDPTTQMYDFKDPVTRFQILAYGGASYSRALGGHDANQPLGASSGFLDPSKNEVNLENSPYNYQKYVLWHGAQFRGMLANQRYYWATFLNQIKPKGSP